MLADIMLKLLLHHPGEVAGKLLRTSLGFDKHFIRPLDQLLEFLLPGILAFGSFLELLFNCFDL